MNKILGIFLVFLLLALSLISFSSAISETDLGGVQKYTDINWWQDFAKSLKNSFVFRFLDSLFKKISFVFWFVFGKAYTPSLEMLILVILWLYFALIARRLWRLKFTPKNSTTLGAATSFFLAHVFVLEFIQEQIASLVDSQQEQGMKVIIYIAIAFAMAIIYLLVHNFTKTAEDVKKKKEEKQTQKDAKEAKAEIKQLKKQKEQKQEESEKTRRARKWLDAFGEEMSKEQGEFESADTQEPEFQA